MASVSSLPSTVSTNPRNSDCGRTNDRGSAFRGFSKGRGGGRGGSRGRGGRSSGRGDASSVRGEHGSGSSTHAPNGKTGLKDIPHAPIPISSDASSTKSSASTLPPSSPGTDASTRSRAGSRRNTQQSMRKPPTMTVTPAPPVAVSLNVSQEATARPLNRRRRSHQGSKAAPAPAQTLTVDSMLKTRRAHSGPVSPTEGLKEAPPHLVTKSADPAVTSFGSKANIDSLVEHVRSMAMDRPSTPGSHIDWAGDEDDSLPDLDDWGVKSTTASASNDEASSVDETTAPNSLELMSPILDDSLKQLPEHLKSPAFSTASLSPRIYPHPFEDLKGSRPASFAEVMPATPSSPLHTPQPSTFDSAPTLSDTTSSDEHGNTDAKEAHTDNASFIPTPLHASQPAKPTTPEPVKPTFTQHPPPPLTSLAPNHEFTSHPYPRSAPPPKGLADSTYAPPRLPKSAQPEKTKVERGLEASIHAPGKPDPVGPFTPHSAPAGPGYHPTHGRSRTLGRPPFFAGAAGMPYRPFQSGVSTPNGAVQTHHNRTQSTPPSAGATRHARHMSRPVITGDAITRLARTLGNVTPKREAIHACASD